MSKQFPDAAPELPVSNVAKAGEYYEKCLGFNWDWGMEGIRQVSRGGCRFFLTDNAFRGADGTEAPVVVWINLDSNPLQTEQGTLNRGAVRQGDVQL